MCVCTAVSELIAEGNRQRVKHSNTYKKGGESYEKRKEKQEVARKKRKTAQAENRRTKCSQQLQIVKQLPLFDTEVSTLLLQFQSLLMFHFCLDKSENSFY